MMYNHFGHPRKRSLAGRARACQSSAMDGPDDATIPERTRRPVKRRAGGRGLDIGPLTGLVGYALRRAQVAAFADFLATTAEVGLRPAQFSVLLLIETNPGCRQSDVAEALGIRRSNFVAMMDELERRGLTRRGRSRRDGRSYALALTPAGREQLARAKALVAAHEARLTGALTPEEVSTLLATLARVERAAQPRPPEPGAEKPLAKGLPSA